MVLVLLRIIRRWNQTGQKWAGEPDISRTFFDHKIIFWGFVGITYLWNLQSLSSRGFPRFPKLAGRAIGAALITASVTFKLAFTNEDSPELMLWSSPSSNPDLSVTLVTRARIAFIAISVALVYTLVTGFSKPRRAEGVTLPISLLDLLLIYFSYYADRP